MAVATIGFHLTDRCQLDCQHCLRDPAQTPKDLPLPLIRKVLTEVQRIHGSVQVALTGGSRRSIPSSKASSTPSRSSASRGTW
ncbi:Hypothetical protein A7982_10773 [Minicystis rosea]|nr:Hypothetical protein A7982_10773 [Minicystis rosea]